MSQQPGCGECGSVADRVLVIQQVSEQLMGAHLALANLYDQLASEQKVEGERRALQVAAKLQRELADLSKFVTMPELLEKENPDVTGKPGSVPIHGGNDVGTPLSG